MSSTIDVIPPLSTTHTHTIILLHGRGSTGRKFSSALLAHPITLPAASSPTTLHHALPNSKLIIPTAPFRRAIFANRSRITQWFDNWSVEPELIEERPEVQIPGLRESVAHVHHLIEEEAKEVDGPRNVVLLGLSLGACVAVTAALCWTGTEPVGAVIGMAGRVPLRDLVEEAIAGGIDEASKDDDDDDLVTFEQDERDTNMDSSPVYKAIQALTQELDLPSLSDTLTTSADLPTLHTPIFLGHGVEDEKVLISVGRKSAEFLQRIGCDVTWREYEGLGHWYHDEELGDIVQFLKEKRDGM